MCLTLLSMAEFQTEKICQHSIHQILWENWNWCVLYLVLLLSFLPQACIWCSYSVSIPNVVKPNSLAFTQVSVCRQCCVLEQEAAAQTCVLWGVFCLPLKLNNEKLHFLQLNSKKKSLVRVDDLKSLVRVDDLTDYCTLLQSWGSVTVQNHHCLEVCWEACQ